MKFIFALFLSAYSFASFCGTKMVYQNSVTGWDPDLFWEMTPVPGYTKEITINSKSHLFIQGHIDVRSRAENFNICGRDGSEAIGVAFQVFIDDDGLNIGNDKQLIRGSTTGGNISNCDDDYYSAYIHGYKVLEADVYPATFHVWVEGRAYSSAVITNTNGIAEVKGIDQYNEVLYIVESID
ncbi:hypothetical protein [Pseudoalteromonas rubra]|uniref:Uncharacterized protein n=1 Tax=Pseudoalteromonas rubra TaxID=43658 RepID=A0A5S3WMV7_9GAMM|nr:hypothetical protein [Pseudoalteromonas rubra]TMP29515.1 hypothetical protein CWB98_23525 [Pseudoalteromonas rubra]